MRVVPGLKAVAAGSLVVLTAIGVHLGAQGQKPAYPQFQRPPVAGLILAHKQAIPTGRRIGPIEAPRVNDLRRPVNAVRLKTGGGIGKRILAVDAITVTLAGPNVGQEIGEGAVGGLGQPDGAVEIFQDDFDLLRLWGPDAKVRSHTFRSGAQRWLPAHVPMCPLMHAPVDLVR